MKHTDAGKPFFCWWNGTRMRLRTHVSLSIAADTNTAIATSTA